MLADAQDLRPPRGCLTNRSPAITTANTENVVLYNASAGNPNTSPSTAKPQPSCYTVHRTGTTTADADCYPQR